MAIEFAPLIVPIKRRLQTLAAIAYASFIIFGGIPAVVITIYIFFFTKYLRIIYLAYIIWIFLIDRNVSSRGGRHCNWVKNWIWWKYIADYFPLKLIKLPWGELDPKRNYLFCCFPHGFMVTGAIITILTESRGFSKIFPHHKAHLHTLNINFIIPFLRDVLLAIGELSSSAESLNFVLGKPEGGNITALIVGGAQEAMHSKPEHYKLVLKNRKGFVKVALKNGSPLVPVISFGEPDIIPHMHFENGSLCLKFQMLVKNSFGFFPLLPLGRGIFQYTYGFLPKRRPINVVVGEPIDVTKVEDPTPEQIHELHQKFIQKLTELFDTQKEHYLKNYENIHLEIV
ncbi:hypothetical protein HHI36_013300 [Cryptolaemus montrouzieri]|uniref:Acyltransferase n=1 Tax=Cryptolaemus montrouzieri TaxID=559131 RepID=A0ABD2NHB7_9CUCU